MTPEPNSTKSQTAIALRRTDQSIAPTDPQSQAVGNNLIRVAAALACPVDKQNREQLEIVAEILLERYSADQIREAAKAMVWDGDLANRIQFRKGRSIGVLDFSQFIDEQEQFSDKTRADLIRDTRIEMDNETTLGSSREVWMNRILVYNGFEMLTKTEAEKI